MKCVVDKSSLCAALKGSRIPRSEDLCELGRAAREENAGYGTACLDTATGRTLWTGRDLNCDHEVDAGPASSPTLIAGNVVVHVDGSAFEFWGWRGRDLDRLARIREELGLEMWPTVDPTQAIHESIALLAEATSGRKSCRPEECRSRERV